MGDLRFNEWQAVDGTPVLRFNAGQLQVWDGSAWAEATRGVGAGIATGGDFTIDEGGYRFLVFTTSGNLVVSETGIFDLCLVAGGGGGAEGADNSSAGGGGGGGGLVDRVVTLEAATYPVVIGAGGGQSNWSAFGVSGGPTYMGNDTDAFYAFGGGGGGRANSSGSGGGSSGGSGTPNRNTTGAPIFGQGFSGGAQSTNTACGGGGAGEAGGNANAGAPGGDGRIVSFINTNVANTASVGEVVGNDVYFSGGGAGGGANQNGGLGGGGRGQSSNLRGGAGVDGTGGGGGGSRSGGGGSAGDGCLIVRFEL